MLLTDSKRIPGTNEDGQIDACRLRSWLFKSQALAREHARKEIGDFVIGQLLARSPIGADEVWPCEPVREVLEELGTAEIARGMSNGVYNSRGVVWREEGGKQERGLAEKYRSWSGSLANQCPFVANAFAGYVQNKAIVTGLGLTKPKGSPVDKLITEWGKEGERISAIFTSFSPQIIILQSA